MYLSPVPLGILSRSRYRVTFYLTRVTIPGLSSPKSYADWIAMKAIVAGVRREGSWKAYCRVEHKRFLRLRSLLVRGRAKTTDARVDRILRLPNGACWNVLAYWREAA